MDSQLRTIFGHKGIREGNPDHAANDLTTSASDSIANILHAVAAEHDQEAALKALRAAEQHFREELAEATAAEAGI